MVTHNIKKNENQVKKIKLVIISNTYDNPHHVKKI